MAGSNQYCAWHECGQLICEMYENGLIVTIDVKGARFARSFLKGNKLGGVLKHPLDVTI